VGKISYFLALSVNISKTTADRSKLLSMTNRKSFICPFDWHQDR